MVQEKSNDRPVEHTDTLGAAPEAVRPIWQRIPKGWIIVALLILAWVGAILVWNGILFLTR